MRKLTVTMRPRKGGNPVVKSRTMNDRQTESHQLKVLVRDIQKSVEGPLRLSDYCIFSV